MWIFLTSLILILFIISITQYFSTNKKPRQTPPPILFDFKQDTSDKPLITIAMAAYNNGSTISQTLQSVLNQSYTHWELILIDDGSTDDTIIKIKAFNDSRIHLFQDGQNKGLPQRLNEVIERAQGKYIARLDADDVFYPQRLAAQCQFLEKHPDIDCVGTGATVFKNNGEVVGVFPGASEHEDICRAPWSGFYLPHPTWMGRTTWFKHYRYSTLMLKAQDQDLLLRAHQKSRFACLPQLLTGYRQERLSVKKSFWGRYFFSKSLIQFGLQERQYLQLGVALIKQIIKFIIDTIVITLNLDRKILVHRALPISQIEKEAWSRCWKDCQGAAKICVE